MKIDLHVHSRHSTRPSQWILQRLGCSESYSDPLRIHKRAKACGMDLVTIADHNTLDGVLEIAHLPDVFMSVEITSYFPEDGCKVHVLALDIDEKTFAEVQKIRENVYDLTEFLRREGLVHICAHPLYGVNNRLTVEHVEKIMLLFRNLELNGARDADSNNALRRIVSSLTPAVIGRLAEKHGIEPSFEEPWRKVLTGGSDDHSGMNIARMYSVVPEAKTLDEFLDGVREGGAHPAGVPAKPETMSHNLYAIAYQFSKNRFKLEKHVGRDVFLSFADRFLGDGEARESSLSEKIQSYLGARRYRRTKSGDVRDIKNLMRFEAARFILEDPALLEIAKSGLPLPENKGEVWFRFVNASANKALRAFADHFLANVGEADFFNIFQSVGSAGALYAILAPHFVAYSVFQEGRLFGRKALTAFEGRRRERPVKIGHFTDTFYEINGVARTLKQSLELAEKLGKDLTMITCDPHGRDCGPGVRNFAPIGVYDLPEYPEQKIFYPPALEMIRFAYEQGFTQLHASTPGPIGLTALLAAKILKLPIHGAYHTQIPQYAKQLTGDEGMEDLAWKYAVWFYNQLDMVFAPSRDTARELAEKGIRPEKIMVYPRGVDVTAFHPEKRNGFLKRFDAADGVNLLYVGRLSKEKNLDLLADAFLTLSDMRPDVNLILTGDGPHAPALREKLAGSRAVFTGYLDGEDLASCFASCDLFVFPSLTDTFGNVILEAQASGLPVVTGAVGGPKENVIHGETGLVLPEMTREALVAALNLLTGNRPGLREMGAKARAAMEDRSMEKAFDESWKLYERLS
jgi:glycosyltransferase involved in cell wall biosynthesis